MHSMIAEEIWNYVSHIFTKPKKTVGRPEFDPKKTFLGIWYVMENGSKWRCLPSYYGKPSTVHGKLMQWAKNGFCKKMFEYLRSSYFEKSVAFKNWLAIDTSSCKAPFARDGGKSPVDRSKRGIKKSIACDSRGTILAVCLAPGNMHDSKTFNDIFDDIKNIKRASITVIAADSAYGAKKHREKAAQNGFILHHATKKYKDSDTPRIKPKGRWIVEAAHSWINNFRGIKTCFSKLSKSMLFFLRLASSSLMFKRL